MKIVKKRRTPSKSSRFSRRRFVVLSLIVLLAVGLGLVLLAKDSTDKPSGQTAVTEQEKKETEQHKENLPDANSSPSSNASGNSEQKKTVKPTITDTSNNSIKSYVSGIFEDGGTCTATFTQAGRTLTKSSTGFENVSYTQCAPIDFEAGFLSTGKWSVTVKYSSAIAEGVSDARSIDIE